jgi:predicted dehydrogenase
MAQLRTAIVGAGFMGGAHTEALRRIGVEIRGILGMDQAESQSAARRLGLPRAYESFDDVCQDESVDVVHLCTPNYLHHIQAQDALLAGKHVLCEKPLAMDAMEGAELVELARERRLAGAVNYNLRYYPLCQEARARRQAGEIGEPRIIHGAYCQDWLFLPTDWNWRLQPELGGALRAVADIGTHWMDMVTWLSGLQIRAVMADFATFIPVRQRPLQAVETFASKLAQAGESESVEIKTEDYAAILLQFENGARGSVVLTQVAAGRKNHFWWEINGSKGSMKWEQERPNELWLGYRERENGLVLKDPSLMHASARRYAGYPGGHAEGYPDTHAQLFREFYGYIAAGAFDAPRLFPTFEDGWRELALCEAVLRSAVEGSWIDIQYK